MDFTKKQIIGEYKKLKLKIGYTPRMREFYKIVPKRTCEDAFPKDTYSTIQTAAGDEPRRFGQRGHSKDEFFEIYGKTIREDIKHVPTQVEWRSKKMKPTVSGYTRQLEIRWSQMPLAFVNWAIDKPEWEDVVDICDSHCREKELYQQESDVSTTNHGYVYLMKANRKGQYKIGRTGSPAGRASQLSQLDPHDRKYEHVFETNDPVAFENYWKEYRFKKKNISKEIFELTRNDVEAFKEFFAKKASR